MEKKKKEKELKKKKKKKKKLKKKKKKGKITFHILIIEGLFHYWNIPSKMRFLIESFLEK